MSFKVHVDGIVDVLPSVNVCNPGSMSGADCEIYVQESRNVLLRLGNRGNDSGNAAEY